MSGGISHRGCYSGRLARASAQAHPPPPFVSLSTSAMVRMSPPSLKIALRTSRAPGRGHASLRAPGDSAAERRRGSAAMRRRRRYQASPAACTSGLAVGRAADALRWAYVSSAPALRERNSRMRSSAARRRPPVVRVGCACSAQQVPPEQYSWDAGAGRVARHKAHGAQRAALEGAAASRPTCGAFNATSCRHAVYVECARFAVRARRARCPHARAYRPMSPPTPPAQLPPPPRLASCAVSPALRSRAPR